MSFQTGDNVITCDNKKGVIQRVEGEHIMVKIDSETYMYYWNELVKIKIIKEKFNQCIENIE